jgi:heme oxygenase (mycobilin-producing)
MEIKMNTVTLINPFSVKSEDEEKFMILWRRVDDYLRAQDGFISTKLHKSLDAQTRLPPATFRYINVALWQSVENFEKAVISEKFKECASEIFPYSGGPGLYEVIVD